MTQTKRQAEIIRELEQNQHAYVSSETTFTGRHVYHFGYENPDKRGRVRITRDTADAVWQEVYPVRSDRDGKWHKYKHKKWAKSRDSEG